MSRAWQFASCPGKRFLRPARGMTFTAEWSDRVKLAPFSIPIQETLIMSVPSQSRHVPRPDLHPTHRDRDYGGAWHKPKGGCAETVNPATGASLRQCAEANAEDVNAAAEAAHQAFQRWRRPAPGVRAEALREISAVMRANKEELAMV